MGSMIEGLRLDRLEALMLARDYGPGELAYQAGVSYNYVYKIRKGLAPHIAARQVAKLAAALRTSSGYLLGVTDDPTPEPAPSSGRVVNAAPIYPADVAGLAARLSSLPASRRAQAVDVISGVLDFSEDDGAEEEAGDDPQTTEFVRRLVRLLDNLPPEKRAQWEAQIQAEAAALHRPASQTR